MNQIWSEIEIIIYWTKQQLNKLNITSINVDVKVTCVDYVREVDETMTNTISAV